MNTTTDRETRLILEYVLKNTSWRKLFFSKFTIAQKILFFLPIPFLYLSIYGAYDLFRNNSWFLFIGFGLLMLFSIWAFFKIKAILENIIFDKFYHSNGCKTTLEYHIKNLSNLLGEQNTLDNRILWKEFFKCKIPKFPFFIATIVFGLIFFSNINRPHDKEYLAGFSVGWFSLLILLMTFAFIMPAITDFKFKGTEYNEAYKLIAEMDNK